MIKLQTGIDMQHVPYRGIGSAYPDVLSGKVQLAFSSIAGAVPFTKDNRVKPLATTRSRAQRGLSQRADGRGIRAARLRCRPVDRHLCAARCAAGDARAPERSELKKALEHPEMKAAMAKIGVEPRGTTVDEADAITKKEFEKWKKVIVDGKIKPE